MHELLEHGLALAAAYGNTMTGAHACCSRCAFISVLIRELADVDAYSERFSLNRIYICGPHAGAGGTQPVLDWSGHLEALWAELPEAQPRIPYINLHF